MAGSIAVGLFCKTPRAGQSKTRLSPPLSPAQCAALSAAFIRDVGATIDAAAKEAAAEGYAIYTPAGSETELRPLLPSDFRLFPQGNGDLGTRLIAAMQALFAAGHPGLIFVNADGPTLPQAILFEATRIVQAGGFAIGPAHDGGYTLIGLPAPAEGLFTDIAWSTPAVLEQTRGKAAHLGLRLHELPLWYDVDDAASLAILRTELAGGALPFAHAGIVGAPAPATRACLAQFDQGRISLVS